MKPEFAQLGFIFEPTADGSPTMRLSEHEERMHHSGGAAAETHYIYTHPIRLVLQALPAAKTCVVGLGLGYIEIAWALCQPPLSAQLTSFEVVPELSEAFHAWVFGKPDGLYDKIAKCLEPQCDINAVKERLAKNFLRNEIRQDIRNSHGGLWNMVCFDAFSKKTSTELWDERFLSAFFANECADDCVFATYGCTGVLKRTLKKHGFTWIDKKSFSGKRDSTLAVRGIFTSGFVSQTF